ncbi:MAG: YqfO family protein [Pseudomonadales bacterium]|nr:YqfO family protein [Pseudomonadales bacterium]
MYKLCFYVPASHLDSVKGAVFSAGAGKIGNYDQCCWQSKGQGQFRPLADSNPFIGEPPNNGPGKVETVEEFKVEMVCDDAIVQSVVLALKAAHPYEEPAFDLWQLSQL